VATRATHVESLLSAQLVSTAVLLTLVLTRDPLAPTAQFSRTGGRRDMRVIERQLAELGKHWDEAQLARACGEAVEVELLQGCRKAILQGTENL
jgi:hypothetical protein